MPEPDAGGCSRPAVVDSGGAHAVRIAKIVQSGPDQAALHPPGTCFEGETSPAEGPVARALAHGPSPSALEASRRVWQGLSHRRRIHSAGGHLEPRHARRVRRHHRRVRCSQPRGVDSHRGTAVREPHRTQRIQARPRLVGVPSLRGGARARRRPARGRAPAHTPLPGVRGVARALPAKREGMHRRLPKCPVAHPRAAPAGPGREGRAMSTTQSVRQLDATGDP